MSKKNEILNLNYNDIELKDFNVVVKGYKAEEVDSYLDIIADDYKKFSFSLKEKDTEIESLNNKIRELAKRNENLTEEKIKLAEQLNIMTNLVSSNASYVKNNALNNQLNIDEIIDKIKK